MAGKLGVLVAENSKPNIGLYYPSPNSGICSVRSATPPFVYLPGTPYLPRGQDVSRSHRCCLALFILSFLEALQGFCPPLSTPALCRASDDPTHHAHVLGPTCSSSSQCSCHCSTRLLVMGNVALYSVSATMVLSEPVCLGSALVTSGLQILQALTRMLSCESQGCYLWKGAVPGWRR